MFDIIPWETFPNVPNLPKRFVSSHNFIPFRSARLLAVRLQEGGQSRDELVPTSAYGGLLMCVGKC